METSRTGFPQKSSFSRAHTGFPEREIEIVSHKRVLSTSNYAHRAQKSVPGFARKSFPISGTIFVQTRERFLRMRTNIVPALAGCALFCVPAPAEYVGRTCAPSAINPFRFLRSLRMRIFLKPILSSCVSRGLNYDPSSSPKRK